MIKFRLYFDKDKETDWINKMSEEGYAMTGFFAGFYWFEKCEPGKYVYQIDFGEKLFAVSNNYREFMQETGIEIVQTWGYWIILRKLASEGEFQLYTDVDSSIEHYTKIRTMFKVVSIIELIGFFMELVWAMEGNPWAVAFMFILAVLTVVMMNATFKTNRIIAELKERKGEVSACGMRNGKLSPLVPCGMLLSSCVTLARETVDHRIIMVVQIIAIIFMIIGLYRSRMSIKKDC